MEELERDILKFLEKYLENDDAKTKDNGANKELVEEN